MKKGLVKLYRIARLLTSKEFTLIFAVAILALLFTGVSTYGHYERKTHEEPIAYEEYHSGMDSDEPVQFCAVSAEAVLYTKQERKNANITNYYAYIIMEDAKGDQVVTVMQKSSSLTTSAYDTIVLLEYDVNSFVDEINDKEGTLYYGVISSNFLNGETVLTTPPMIQNYNEKESAEIKSQIKGLQTLKLYTGKVPQSTTVVDESEFVRDGGSWLLLTAVVLLALYIVMCVARHILEKQGAAELADKEDASAWNVKIPAPTPTPTPTPTPVPTPTAANADAWRAEVHRQAQQRAQEDRLRREKEQAAEKAAQPKPAPAPAAAKANNADAWRAEVHRQAERRAQEDKQRKEKERAAEKAVQPKTSPAPAAAKANNADAWRAEVHRQAQQRAQEDRLRKEKEMTGEKDEILSRLLPNYSIFEASRTPEALSNALLLSDPPVIQQNIRNASSEDLQILLELLEWAADAMSGDTQTIALVKTFTERVLQERSKWTSWAKDKSNHEKLQKLCGVKLVHTENQGMFTAYSYTLGPKGWNDIKRIMVTIAASDQEAGAKLTLESGSMGSETATETIEISAGNKVSGMDIKLEENGWMRLTAGSKIMNWSFRLHIYNQTGYAMLQILFAPEDTGEVTLYLCGVLAATFGIAGKAPSGDVEQGINAVIEYIDAQKDNSLERNAAEDTKCTNAKYRKNKNQLSFVQKSAKYYDGESPIWAMEYTCNREYSFMEIVKAFQDIPSTSIDVRELSHVGFPSISGDYDMDHFMKDYDSIMKWADIWWIEIRTEYQQKRILIKMWPQSTSIKLCIIEKSWGKQTLQFVESVGQQIMEFIANGGGNR